jgi:hypothetical protein
MVDTAKQGAESRWRTGITLLYTRKTKSGERCGSRCVLEKQNLK